MSRSRIGRAATQCEVKVPVATRAVAPQACCGSDCGFGRLGVFPTGVSPGRSLSASEWSGLLAATSVDMVVREGRRSGGEISDEILTSICLDASSGALNLRQGIST
jgi:hypothetical protein